MFVCLSVNTSGCRENKGISHDVKGETHTSEFSGAPETKQFDSSDQSSSAFHQVDLMFIFSCFSFCCDKADPASTLNLSVTTCGSAAVSGLSEIHKPGDGLKHSLGEKVARKASDAVTNSGG